MKIKHPEVFHCTRVLNNAGILLSINIYFRHVTAVCPQCGFALMSENYTAATAQTWRLAEKLLDIKA